MRLAKEKILTIKCRSIQCFEYRCLPRSGIRSRRLPVGLGSCQILFRDGGAKQIVLGDYVVEKTRANHLGRSLRYPYFAGLQRFLWPCVGSAPVDRNPVTADPGTG